MRHRHINESQTYKCVMKTTYRAATGSRSLKAPGHTMGKAFVSRLFSFLENSFTKIRLFQRDTEYSF